MSRRGFCALLCSALLVLFFEAAFSSSPAYAATLTNFSLKTASLLHDKQKPNNDKLTLKGTFQLGAGDTANPAQEPVVLAIGPFAQTISANSFTQKDTARKTTWKFKGSKGGLTSVTIVKAGNEWTLTAIATGLSLSLPTSANAMPVSLHIGDDSGSIQVFFAVSDSAKRTLLKFPAGKKDDADGDGLSTKAGDCDDQDPTVFPGAEELCDGQDNDCDGQIDDGAVLSTFYRDGDGDSFGDPAQTIQACTAPTGFVADNTDCNDSALTIHPGAAEICGNAIDEDCSGADEACGVTRVETSPFNGEEGVSVTRETIVRFSQPLASSTVVDDSIFFAEFSGQRLAGQIHMAPDRKTVTLFYQDNLPASARVRATFIGDSVVDELGQAVDADGDGAAGGTALIDFDTITLTTFPGTKVCGRVFASELAPGDSGMSVNVPLQGVTITVDGQEDTLRTVSDVDGNFCLDPAPAGRFFAHVDGRTATNGVPPGAYYPYVGEAWESIPGQTMNIGNTYLPLVSPGSLQPVSQTTDTTITFPQAILDQFPQFQGVQVTVPANALFADDGTRGGMVGIAPVPPDRLPGQLPPGLEFPLVITVQTDGATNFDVPVPACFPNLPDPALGHPLSPGEKNGLFSFNHDAGKWEYIGPMTVSADGRLICTDPGVGIRAPGWHGSGPPPIGPPPTLPGFPPLPDPNKCPDMEGLCNSGAETEREVCVIIYTAAAASAAFACPPGVWGLICLAVIPFITLDQLDQQCEMQFDKQSEECSQLCPAEQAINRLSVHTNAISLEDPIVQQITQIVQDISFLLKPYIPSGQSIPENIRSQVSTLLAQANTIAGGDAILYLRNRALQAEEEAASFQIIPGEARGNAPPYPVLYLATVLRTNGEAFVLRGETGPHGQYSLFVPRDGTLLSVNFYDPRTKSYGNIFPRLRSNAPFRLPRFYLLPVDETFPDFDHDGLVDVVEVIYGTSTNDPDSDNDGILDGAEVDQGTNPLDGSIARTGVIATADTPGNAVDVCAANDRVAIADSAAGVAVFNVFNGMTPTIIAQVNTPGTAQAVACAGDRIAVADGSAGLAIIDINNPANARVVHQVNLGGTAQAVTTAGGVAYVGLSTAQVVMIDLTSGAELERVNFTASIQDVAVSGKVLYVLTSGVLWTVSLAEEPLRVVKTVASPGSVGAGGRRLRLFVGGGIAYAVHTRGYNTFRLTDPLRPTLIASGNTAQASWKHLVLNGSGLGVAAVGPNSTNDGPHDVSLYDVSDLTLTDVFLTTFVTPGFASAVAIHNGLAYVADGSVGMQVVNFVSPDQAGVAPTGALVTGAVGGVVEGSALVVRADVTDDVMVRNVDFSVNGQLAFSDGNFPFESLLPVPVGAAGTMLNVSAIARDLAGNQLNLGTAQLAVLNATGDKDGDGLSNSVEQRLGLDPTKPDTDGDGVSDGDEDQDTDGLSNRIEINLGLDPLISDTDRDGIPDRGEDTDGDGIANGGELEAGCNPAVPEVATVIGKAVDGQGHPVGDAEARVLGRTDLTDAQGNFSITNAPACLQQTTHVEVVTLDSPTLRGTSAPFVLAVGPVINTGNVVLTPYAPLLYPGLKYPSGGIQPFAVTTADLNKDSILDVVVANGGSDEVTVFLGNGDGSLLPGQSFDVGFTPIAMTVGDVDGDDVLDVITANRNSNDISVLLGNGNGTFLPQQRSTVGTVPVAVAVGDFNRDNILDVVTANANSGFSGDLSIVLGNGDGTFQTQQLIAVGAFVRSVAVADFNKDGIVDLVTGTSTLGGIAVLLGNGDGTFQPPQLGTSAGITSILVEDLNADGLLDVVTTNPVSLGANESIYVLLGKGNGTFHPAQSFEVGDQPQAAALADVNGDSILDVLTVNWK